MVNSTKVTVAASLKRQKASDEKRHPKNTGSFVKAGGLGLW
jgi:hypothetical protein